MNIVVTAGNTQTPIDQVRVITNIFTGRTGATIAAVAAARGHTVTLLTSHPETIDNSLGVTVRAYRWFEELASLLASTIAEGPPDAIIHAAAVSDYHVTGVYTRRDTDWVDVAADKIKSHHSELWLKLVPTPKLIDKIRSEWKFRGTLVKFKLEVGVTESELLRIAEESRRQSEANLICANTLEGRSEWAYLGAETQYRRIPRSDLAATLVAEVERLAELH